MRAAALRWIQPVTSTGFSTSTNFPSTVGAFQHGFTGGLKAFVAKINPAASGPSSLIYSTSLDGSAGTGGYAIAVDAHFNAYVTGTTTSASDFPITSGAFQGNNPMAICGTPINIGAGGCGFVTKINAAGSGLIYSTLLGAAGTFGWGIAVDSLGNAHVAGSAGGGANFPLQPTHFSRLTTQTAMKTRFSRSSIPRGPD